jgi:hypothetical protein
MKRLMASAVAVLVVAFSMFAATPASADSGHYIYTPHSLGWAIYQGESITTCHDWGGGTYAVVHFKNWAFGPVHHTEPVLYGCIAERHPDVYEFRVCESTDGCSAWHSRH